MPKQTFENLDPIKRQEITDAFLKEFSVYSYDEASITRVVRSLGIAKGSVYQYFDNKLDLFMYLQQYCAGLKAQYINHLQRTDFQDFWQYWMQLYAEGLKYDREHPLASNFLLSIHQHADAPNYQSIYREQYRQILEAMNRMIEKEVEDGHFRHDLPVASMAFFLYNMASRLPEYMEAVYGVDLKKNKQDGRPIYDGIKYDTLIRSMEDYIKLLKPAFEPQ